MAENTLSGKVVVITGASSGFGKGAAREFAQAGAHLVLAARRDTLLDELARECTTLGVRAVAVPTDVSDPDDVRRLFEAALEDMGHIDVWVNNAGVGAIGCFEDTPLEDHEQVVQTNLLGVIYGSWHAWRHFLERGQGTLINIASELGKTSVPYYSSYTAAKHGVVGLSASLRQELMENKVENVHVCCIMPTAHDTPFFDHAANYTGRATEAPTPLHDPKEVVDTIVKLARNPKDETIVGSDGYMKFALAHLARHMSEAMGAKQMHKVAIENAPPAPVKHGAVREPMEEGTAVTAGRRGRQSSATPPAQR